MEAINCILIAFLCLSGLEVRAETYEIYFSDIWVVSAETKKRMTSKEVMDLLYASPKVANVSIPIQTKLFTVESLLFPQHRHHYVIPKSVFIELQKRSLEELTKGLGVQEVREHWKSIVQGKPPFGLEVER